MERRIKMIKVNETRYDVLGIALRKMFYGKAVDVTDIYYARGNAPKRFGVNWAACGTKTVEEANDFAKNLKKAMDIAEYLNSLELVLEYFEDGEEDKFINTGEAFQSVTESMMCLLEDLDELDREHIKAFLETNVKA
jgi:hypothetical protein